MFRAIEANLVSGEEKPKSVPYLPATRSVNVCVWGRQSERRYGTTEEGGVQAAIFGVRDTYFL